MGAFGHRTALADRIDAWLPQTQCTQCGYPRCRVYAEAIARGEADINRCPPGAEVTIAALARLLEVAAKPLDPSCGVHAPRQLALIDEAVCIGCTLCIQACPVDAILGAAKHMHTVIAQECTGCALCLPPCPVDCIALAPYADDREQAQGPWPEYSREEAARWRRRTEARQRRLFAGGGRAHRRARRVGPASGKQAMRREIAEALVRVRARRARRARFGGRTS